MLYCVVLYYFMLFYVTYYSNYNMAYYNLYCCVTLCIILHIMHYFYDCFIMYLITYYIMLCIILHMLFYYIIFILFYYNYFMYSLDNAMFLYATDDKSIHSNEHQQELSPSLDTTSPGFTALSATSSAGPYSSILNTPGSTNSHSASLHEEFS